jgi:hypothetical protein
LLRTPAAINKLAYRWIKTHNWTVLIQQKRYNTADNIRFCSSFSAKQYLIQDIAFEWLSIAAFKKKKMNGGFQT